MKTMKRRLERFWFVVSVAILLVAMEKPVEARRIDLKNVTIVQPAAAESERTAVAARVLKEELEKRIGERVRLADAPPSRGVVFEISAQPSDSVSNGATLPERRPEGFRVEIRTAGSNITTVQIVGADKRGALYGVGHVLRAVEWGPRGAWVPSEISAASAPKYGFRGFQLGYRNTANSWDAWTPEQYEQYIRELVLFGANAIENIPIQDSDPSPHMKLSREEMNVRISRICQDYGIEYWVWVPADFDLADSAKKAEGLELFTRFCRRTPYLNGVFVPGGDPGDNHPRLLLPHVRDLATILTQSHPNATVWMSLQGFNREKADYVYTYLQTYQPDWFGGVINGPQSPLIQEDRARTPRKYAVRHYPDITHTVRCLYQTPQWDPAFAVTLGREPVNPEPVYYALIHNAFAPFSHGFMAYSDGVHDDVNKVVFSVRAWDPEADVREILCDYTRFFFGSAVSDLAADGILALERNWRGPVPTNGGIDATLALWQNLDRMAPENRGNWRWQMCQLRANYDAYVRQRLLYETSLENEANEWLLRAQATGADSAAKMALRVLEKATTEPVRPELRARVEQLCDDLFRSIGLQTSVPKYQASGLERGAVLDFVDHPLNNRLWLQDQLAKVRSLTSETEKVRRLEEIARWENPGEGSFYDDIGHIAKQPHVVTGEGLSTDPMMIRNPNPGFWAWDNNRSTWRPSLSTAMWSGHHQTGWPIALQYTNLDSGATFVLRVTGLGDAFPRANGERLVPTLYGTRLGEFKEFPLPRHLTRGGELRITWDIPDEADVNWRNKSRVSEAWLLKR